MVCIYCDSKVKTSVVNSRSSATGRNTWRRRQCSNCGSIMTTREQIDLENAIRVRHSDTLEPFLRDRLFLDVSKSVSHRKNALTDSRDLTDTIITLVLPLQVNGVIDAAQIVKITHETLSRFDKAAGVYYSAHFEN